VNPRGGVQPASEPLHYWSFRAQLTRQADEANRFGHRWPNFAQLLGFRRLCRNDVAIGCQRPHPCWIANREALTGGDLADAFNGRLGNCCSGIEQRNASRLATVKSNSKIPPVRQRTPAAPLGCRARLAARRASRLIESSR